MIQENGIHLKLLINFSYTDGEQYLENLPLTSVIKEPTGWGVGGGVRRAFFYMVFKQLFSRHIIPILYDRMTLSLQFMKRRRKAL